MKTVRSDNMCDGPFQAKPFCVSRIHTFLYSVDNLKCGLNSVYHLNEARDTINEWRIWNYLCLLDFLQIIFIDCQCFRCAKYAV